ncbi:hypothetical protein NBRC116596_09440 [Litorivita sp. NS0012-18]
MGVHIHHFRTYALPLAKPVQGPLGLNAERMVQLRRIDPEQSDLGFANDKAVTIDNKSRPPRNTKGFATGLAVSA